MMSGSSPIQPIAPATDELLQDFLDNATVAIHMINDRGTIIYANRAELEMLGYTAAEYIGHNLSEFYEDQSLLPDLLTKLFSHEEVRNQDALIKCKDGYLKNVLISSNVRWENGVFINSRCITRDISAQKKVEQLLRLLNKASEELSGTLDTQLALDKMTSFIVPKYADWFVIDILKEDNSIELLKMVHADPDKLKWAKIYRSHNQVDLHEDTEGSVGWVIRNAQPFLISAITDDMITAAGKNPGHLEILRNLALRSAMVVPMSINGLVIGTVSFLSCTPGNNYDNTDLNFAKDFSNRIALTLENARLYEQAQKDIIEKIETNKRKDEFLSIASHELKTPVTSLKAFTQILQMKFAQEANPMAADLLSKMDKQIDKLTNLIVDLLDITKVSNGEIVFNLEAFSFSEMVEEIAEEIQRTTATHKIVLNVMPCDHVMGDRARLGQVIVNLLSNAIKYSPGANEILLSASCNKDIVKLCVRDFGIGIPQAEQSKLFKRFFRVIGNNNQHTFPGLGLGLYISSEIIERHNGKIYFESKEGNGSTFCFELPGIPG